MVHNGADAMKRRRAETYRAEEQLNAIHALPCRMFWSDGSQTETTLGESFYSEKDYYRYKKYKKSGKAYPVRVEVIEPPKEELEKPSTIFPKGTKGGEYKALKKMCEMYTGALERYIINDTPIPIPR